MSPWHDVPLRAGDGVFHFVVEIPKESSAKMEVATDEAFTPIKQDTKKGNLRYYPYNINWNYGLLPQTWEDPTSANSEVEGAFGDNDPVDVVEIGERRANVGDVLKVKPLAALAMIDEGELDWKIVAISLDDPKASLVNDVDDVEKHFPGTLTAIRDWFRDYKIPDGKPANKFGLGNKPASKEYALKVIQETNESWEKLVKRNIPASRAVASPPLVSAQRGLLAAVCRPSLSPLVSSPLPWLSATRRWRSRRSCARRSSRCAPTAAASRATRPPTTSARPASWPPRLPPPPPSRRRRPPPPRLRRCSSSTTSSKIRGRVRRRRPGPRRNRPGRPGRQRRRRPRPSAGARPAASGWGSRASAAAAGTSSAARTATRTATTAASTTGPPAATPSPGTTPSCAPPRSLGSRRLGSGRRS